MENFVYGLPGAVRKCLVCGAPTFYYSAYRMCWSYCNLCGVFYTPHRKREIGAFLMRVKEALSAKVT
jgi:hypothetical protein